MEKAARIMSWCLLLAIVAVTDGPIDIRPTTMLPPNVERFAALFVVGVVFAIGYMQHPKKVLMLLVGSVCLIELLQNFTPGRHAGWTDLIVKIAGIYLGVMVGRIVYALHARHLQKID